MEFKFGLKHRTSPINEHDFESTRKYAILATSELLSLIKTNEIALLEQKMGSISGRINTIESIDTEIDSHWHGVKINPGVNIADVVYRKKKKLGAVKAINTELMALARININFINQLDQDMELIDRTWFIAIHEEYGNHAISCTQVTKIATCYNCKEVVEATSMLSHQQEYKCFTQLPSPDGYTQVEEGWGDKNGRLATLSLIPEIQCKFVPATYKVFAPNWVIAAIKTYEVSPFADLTLEQYLNKMLPQT